MNEIPKPASPLPWKYEGNEYGGEVTAADKRLVCDNEDYYPAAVDHADMAYIVWAANNAPKFAARIERLEAALREIAEMFENVEAVPSEAGLAAEQDAFDDFYETVREQIEVLKDSK